MSQSITLNQLNEALARQTVLILDRVDEMIDQKLSVQTEDISEQLVDMMSHIDHRFNRLEGIVDGTIKRVDGHETRISKLERITNIKTS